MIRSIMLKKYTLFGILFFSLSLPAILPAQEALKSAEEEYYDFLALQGLTERPALNYRTLSDSVWAVDATAEHPWQQQNLGVWHPLFGDFRLRAYGPELFMSGNTAAPYGQNDGVLWQGRGFNALLKGGVRFEGYGVELTLLPHFSFSQNAEFDFIQPAYSGPDFSDKAEKYGYYGVWGIDAPQRFGDKPFFDWDLGDSEIRYTWRTLTVGFGTQTIWLGPAQLNPIIHSNNAASYPKLDIGLRRQAIVIPRIGWHIGDIEFRAWWGYLTESDWFDNIDSNNHNLITGVSLAYSFPWIFKGLTIGFNRIMLSKWDDMNFGTTFILLWPFMDNSAGSDNNDQRASVTIEYLLPLAGINVYWEWGRNDFSPGIDDVVRYPFHTQGWTAGMKKTLSINNYLKGELLLEVTNIESSRDYELMRSTTFYAHHIIIQGHTNKGQWLGAGIGTGGNSQYLGFKLYFPKGCGGIFIQRRNPDLDFTWFIDSVKHPELDEKNFPAVRNIRTFLDFGLLGNFRLLPNLTLSGSIVFRDEHNPINEGEVLINNSYHSLHRYNFHLALGLKYFL
jgi:hypothetical protein